MENLFICYQFTLIKNHLYKDILKFIRYAQKDYLKNNWYFIKADFEDQKIERNF